MVPLPDEGYHRSRVRWNEIPGWFQWRSAQEEAAQEFPEHSRFVEVGNFLGRSLCSLGEVARLSGKRFSLIGVDTCLGSGPEGPRGKDYHGAAVAQGGGTLAGTLHKNIIDCGYGDLISLIVADSVTASTFFPDRSIEWVHLDARHDPEHLAADIAAWLPKLKPGGWLSGDDYDEVKWPDVVSAIGGLLPGARPWSVNQWRWMPR
jgi:Methyltransferase domain